jgi:DNA-binding CsgD family transcriptional regulator
VGLARHRRCDLALAVKTRRADAARPVQPDRARAALDADRQIEPAAPDTAGSLEHLCALPIPREATLRSLFELTGAEARLAQHLARGDSVEEIARTLGVKIATARTQLAAIFSKTGARRQAKLVAILSHLAHVEGGDGERPAGRDDLPATAQDGVLQV